MHRLKIISGHLSPPGSSEHRRDLWRSDCGSLVTKSPQDVVVVHGLRTAVCKAKRGAFKDTTPDEMLSAVMKAVMTDVGLSADKLGDVCVGNVLQPGAGALVARIAHFLSGFPETVPVSTVNRQCSSGLQALFNIAGAIRSGSIDLGLACGVESMSLRSMGDPGDLSPRLTDFDKARDCIIPMGVTSENVAEKFGVSREKQDAFALSSQQKAARAQSSGVFEQEIVPVSTRIIDEDGTERELTVAKDDGIRAGTTLSGLNKLRAAFKPDGSTTAGNSSQVSDGAAAVLIGRRSAVEALGLPVLGVLRASAVVGVPPDLMGIGPAYAIPAALKQAGLTVADIDVFEINEAFASQAVYCVEHLGIPLEKVNPNGGAIALGHPLGCTGARQVVTLLHELRRRGKRAYGVVSMCIGTGMGAAAVFEYPGP
ncbi:3-ketoacyl-CoA thiolase, peroxisomal [Dissostichus eleginoides]|uniref:3-ketoacyl-CoA thiolase peroxisomal n=1 Tax=Dissostichus eleginoides TaxID=100907 RepID=A0AAD9BQF2_DISEL|nr:3-ketoacyl-CoA thiolase, peroxisomal [Dissostichus eleginoides]KAK1886094.1 3-ketoacyl-CoA thiolase peroxisomal [Dissostichus eleginoides]